MKVTRILIYQVSLPVLGGSYRISHARDYVEFLSSIVIVETDVDIAGVGESCPFGTAYAEAFAGGIAPALAEIAPFLIGQDPRDVGAINNIMDKALLGHHYAKSPIDIACWDILGQYAGCPIYRLMGGLLSNSFTPRMGVSIAAPVDAVKTMRHLKSQGFKRFNIKAGDDPDRDLERISIIAETADSDDLIVVDANGGWLVGEAIYVMSKLAGFPKLFFEQPCASYEECRTVRERVAGRIVLDESLVDLDSLLRSHRESVADAATIKINKIGGLTKSRLVRDVCIELGIPLFIQDSWGSQITDATIAQLCHSTSDRFLLGGWNSSSYAALPLVKQPLLPVSGWISANERNGLGIELNRELLGQPIAVYD